VLAGKALINHDDILFSFSYQIKNKNHHFLADVRSVVEQDHFVKE
jgi:hypothetical protein